MTAANSIMHAVFLAGGGLLQPRVRLLAAEPREEEVAM